MAAQAKTRELMKYDMLHCVCALFVYKQYTEYTSAVKDLEAEYSLWASDQSQQQSMTGHQQPPSPSYLQCPLSFHFPMDPVSGPVDLRDWDPVDLREGAAKKVICDWSRNKKTGKAVSGQAAGGENPEVT